MYNSHTIRKPGNKIELYKLDSDPKISMTITKQSPKNMFIKKKNVLCLPNWFSSLNIFPIWLDFTSLLSSIDLYKRSLTI